MTSHKTILLALAPLVLAVAVLWAQFFMSSRRQAALAAAEDLSACRRMTSEISFLSGRPAMASDRERMASEVSGLVEKAAKLAGITPEKLLRISPEPAQRLGQTAYKEKPTRVLLRNTSMQQLVALLHALTGPDQGLAAKDIRLTAPRPDDTDNIWNVELTLTYLIYELGTDK